MKIFRFITRWFTIEFGSKNTILFSVAILFLSGGIAMLTENFWIHFFDTAIEIILKKEDNYINEIIGSLLLAIGFGFLYLAFKNWKTDIYLTVYDKVQQTVNELYSTLHLRQRGFNKVAFQDQHDFIYKLYKEGTQYVDSNKILINESIAILARKILYGCARELEYFQATINKTERLMERLKSLDTGGSYNYEEDLKESIIQIEGIVKDYRQLENALKAKLVWKFL